MIPWKSTSAPEKLGKKEIHIWKIPLGDEQNDPFTELLSIEEQQRADSFRFSRDRNRFIRTHSRLRELLSSYSGLSTKELRIAHNAYGKPYLVNPTAEQPLFFNISHSKDLALFAFSHHSELGIDVEYARDTVQCLELAKRFFSREEYQALADLSRDVLKTQFYRYWTCKEAFIKAVGSGLSFPLDKFTVSIETGASPKLLWADETLFTGECKLFSLPVHKQFYASLACLGDPRQLLYFI